MGIKITASSKFYLQGCSENDTIWLVGVYLLGDMLAVLVLVVPRRFFVANYLMMLFVTPRYSINAFCKSWEKLILCSSAMELSHAGKVTVRLTDLLM